MQHHRRGDVREIDPDLGLGLHELANPKQGNHSFAFQLRYSKEQSENILSQLPSLVEKTIAKAPLRTKDFCLNRSAVPELTHEEDKWERAMHEKWGPNGSGEFISICKRIQTYQYHLRATLADRCWGPIDLLGIGVDSLPVPIELKKRKPEESPLRMLVEIAAYGFAIRKVWQNLKPYWIEAVGQMERPGSLPPPKTLDRVTLVCMAPEEYWCWCLGLLAEHKDFRFPNDAWQPFWQLVDALGTWFDIHFGAIEGCWDDENGGSPTIFGARLLDLRLLTYYPTPANSHQGRTRQAREGLLDSYKGTV